MGVVGTTSGLPSAKNSSVGTSGFTQGVPGLEKPIPFRSNINVSTQFELAYCFGKKLSEELGDTYAPEGTDVLALIKAGFPYMGAEAKLSLNIKEGAVYPNSIKLITKGNAFNPFAEFEDDDED